MRYAERHTDYRRTDSKRNHRSKSRDMTRKNARRAKYAAQGRMR